MQRNPGPFSPFRVGKSSKLMRCFFLSDLHLFSRRTDFGRYEATLERAADRADMVVLGGDIFDFKWSCYRSLDATIEKAVEWVAGLTDRHPKCSFYYLLGNHDSHPRFVSALDRLVFGKPNLQWQPYWLRFGQTVFLHGDVLDGGMDHREVDERRKKHSGEPVPEAYRHWLYDVAVQVKVHRAVATFARRRAWVLKKLSRYLSEQGIDAGQGVRDVYFGHTHRPMSAIRYDGLVFHNGGACIKGLPFRILELQLAS